MPGDDASSLTARRATQGHEPDAHQATTMTLNPHPNFPLAACYVLKLHRDAMPRPGQLHGRLEHIVSGDCHDFANADGLLAWLLHHAARARPVAPSTQPQELR
jgi:hypothetical protein